MPCYSYVMYRTLDKVSDDRGYFHAAWRQEALLLGQRDYLALEAKGRGKFIGWNATVRLPGRPELSCRPEREVLHRRRGQALHRVPGNGRLVRV